MSRQRTPLRILHVTFNMGIGGTEQVITQLIEGSDPGQLEHQVVCIDGEIGDMGRQLMAQGVPVLSMPRQPGIDLKLAWSLRRHIRKQKIDIVHCHQYTPYFYGWLATRLTGASAVFTEHGRFHPDRYRTRAKWVNRIMASTTASLTAISRATAEALVEYEYLPARKIQVIYNGIRGKQAVAGAREDLGRELGIAEDARVLCMVSRLDPIKNHSLVLRALRQLLDKGEKVELVIVGDGPERGRIEGQVRELGLDVQVHLVGHSPNPERYVSMSDLYLLTSYSEGTSMTLLEAMSLGIGVVATEVGGNPEIITDGETGCLIPSDDLDALVATLNRLLSRPDQIERLGTAARQTFEAKFSVANMVDNYTTLYHSIAGTRR